MSVATKKDLRKLIGRVLRTLSAESKMEQSTRILGSIKNLKEYHSAKSVGLYLPMNTEVDTRCIMEDCFGCGKSVVVPKILTDSEFEWVSIDSCSVIDALPRDKWGIPIPEYHDGNRLLLHPELTPDLIIVPGVAFDSHCQRLGHGKGYYDRSFEFLKHWCQSHQRKYPILMGVAFEEQIVESVPVSEHDVALDMVVTASKTYRSFHVYSHSSIPKQVSQIYYFD